MTWLPNKYAKCECTLDGMPEFPICTHYEKVPDEDCDDCCVACRHGEECHLKGYVPMGDGGRVEIPEEEWLEIPAFLRKSDD